MTTKRARSARRGRRCGFAATDCRSRVSSRRAAMTSKTCCGRAAMPDPDDSITSSFAGAVAVEFPAALPDLIIDKGNLPAAVREIRDLLAADGNLFDRGSILVAVRSDAATGALSTHELRVSN